MTGITVALHLSLDGNYGGDNSVTLKYAASLQYAEYVVMTTVLMRILGLFLLVLTITVPSCQAVFTPDTRVNAPAQMSPGSFTNGR